MQIQRLLNSVSNHCRAAGQSRAIVPAVSAFVALVAIGLTSRLAVGDEGLPMLVASMGAAAVLIYAAPDSPMSQPWPLVGGHLVSACIGVTCYKWVPDVVFASALAVSISIFVMHFLRCQHPPGGAAAMVAVVGGPSIHALGYGYMFVPIGLNVAVMLLVMLAVRRFLVPQRRVSQTQEDATQSDNA